MSVTNINEFDLIHTEYVKTTSDISIIYVEYIKQSNKDKYNKFQD